MKDGRNEVALEEFSWDDDFGTDDEMEAPIKAPVDIHSEAEYNKPLKLNKDGLPEEEEEEAEEVEAAEETEEVEVSDEAEAEESDEAADSTDESPELWTSLAQDLQSRGYDLGLEEGGQLDERGFYDKLTGFVGNSVKGAIEQWKSGFDEESQQYIRFIQNGGKPADYYKTIGASSWRNYDTSTETGAESLVRYYLKNVEGADDDFITDEITDLQDTDKLQRKAELYEKRLDEKSKQERNILIEQQERQRIDAERAEQERVAHLQKASVRIKEVGGVPIDGGKVFDYITRPTVKEGNGYVSPFGAKLKEVLSGDTEKLFLLAELLRTDFDFGAIERQAETKVTRKTKDLLQRSKASSNRTRGGTQGIPLYEAVEF